jgi:NDP-sugar pyrophosphorylase family protein
MMTKGIILPTAKEEIFKPLTYQMPVGMLPIVNKPLMEHQVELFVRNGIRDIRISCNHLSNEVEGYFQGGGRWGASITYNFERPPFGVINALHQMRPFIHANTLVIIQSDTVSDAELQDALEFHRQQRADATFLCYRSDKPVSGFTVSLDAKSRIQAVGRHREIETTQLLDSGICILEPEILDLLPEGHGYNFLQTCWLASQRLKLKLSGFAVAKPLTRINGWTSFAEVQRKILEGGFPGVLVPGIQVKRGAFIGKNVNASGNVAFDPPIVIGDNCRIGRNSKLGRGTIIGHDVMVESGSVLERAIIFPNAFIGAGTLIRDAIIVGNLMIDTVSGSFCTVEDSLALSEVQRGQYVHRLYHMLNRFGACVLSALLIPLVLMVLIGLVVGLKFPLISKVRRIGVDLRELAAGNLRLKVFDLIYLGPIENPAESSGYNKDPNTVLPHVISRMGNLLNIITGDILFVGNRPMDPETAFGATEEWQRTRFKCQSGFVSILDGEEAQQMSREDQIIAEGYYAVNRSVGMDVKTLLIAMRKVLKRLIPSGSPRRGFELTAN